MKKYLARNDKIFFPILFNTKTKRWVKIIKNHKHRCLDQHLLDIYEKTLINVICLQTAPFISGGQSLN
jgi:uncharacterized protein YpbB